MRNMLNRMPQRNPLELEEVSYTSKATSESTRYGERVSANAATVSAMEIPENAAQCATIARFGALPTHDVQVRQELRQELRREAHQNSERAAAHFALGVYTITALLILLVMMPSWALPLTPYWLFSDHSLPSAMAVWRHHQSLSLDAINGIGYASAIGLFFSGWIAGRETGRSAVGASLRALPVILISLLFATKLIDMTSVYVFRNLIGTDFLRNFTDVLDQALWLHCGCFLVCSPLSLIGAWIGGNKRRVARLSEPGKAKIAR